MSESISSLLECSLCFESFDNNKRLPKMLSCQHTACLECLDRMVGKKKNIVCATCRFEYKVPKQGVKGLPNNLTILSMMHHVCEKERRQYRAKKSNIKNLRRTLLSTVQSVNNKLSNLDSVSSSFNDSTTDQKSTMKSIDDCFQRIYVSLENRREVLKNDVDARFQKVSDVALKVSNIAERKMKAVSFCSMVVDRLEEDNNTSEKDLASLLETARDILKNIDEVHEQVSDVNETLTESIKPVEFSNIMEDSLILQISCLGRIHEPCGDGLPTKDILRDLMHPVLNNIGFKELKQEAIVYEQLTKHVDNHDRKCIANVKDNSTTGKNLSGGGNRMVQKQTNLKVVLPGRPIDYKWNEKPLTFGESYFSILQEGALDLALIRDEAAKELAVTTEFSQTVGVFDEKLNMKKQLGEPWNGYVRGLCTDDRGRLVTVTNIGDVFLFETNRPSGRVKRIYSVYQGQGAVHSDYASTKCGIALSKKRVLYLANDKDGCVDVIRGKNGRLLRKIGKNRCMEPRGIALTSDENILIADARNHCVWLYAQDGQCVGKYGKQGNGVGELSEPWGVAIDKDENVVVADTGNHRIQIFDKNGISLAILGEHGSDAGQFDWPMSVTVTINGKIIVCDSGNYRIQIL